MQGRNGQKRQIKYACRAGMDRKGESVDQTGVERRKPRVWESKLVVVREFAECAETAEREIHASQSTLNRVADSASETR